MSYSEMTKEELLEVIRSLEIMNKNLKESSKRATETITYLAAKVGALKYQLEGK